jgi:hypothetical protein
MSNLYITEYAEQARDEQGQHILAGKEPAIATQKVAFTGTAGTSAAFNALTTFVRIHADGIASVKFGTAPTATTSDPRIGSGVTEFFGVQAGASLKVSAITNT